MDINTSKFRWNKAENAFTAVAESLNIPRGVTLENGFYLVSQKTGEKIFCILVDVGEAINSRGDDETLGYTFAPTDKKHTWTVHILDE